MSDDITTALRGFAEAQRRAADVSAPDQGVETASLARRVSRRRAVRTGSVALTTVAVASGVVVGTLLSGSRTPAPPALPNPAPTSTWSTPSPTAAPTTWSLRDAQPLDPTMLESTGDGWVMLASTATDEGGTIQVPETTYLVSPAGQPFVVPAGVLDGWHLTDWLPGSSLVTAVGQDGTAHVLDLTTGEVGPALGSGSSAQFVGDGTSDLLVTAWDEPAGRVSRVGRDGAVRATTAPAGPPVGAAVWVQSPDRSQIVVNDPAGPRAITTAGFTPTDLPVPYPDRRDACRARMWVDDTMLLMECTAAGETSFDAGGTSTEVWLVPVDGGAPRQVVDVPTQERLGGVWRLGDRLVAGSFGPSESEASWWEITDDGVTPLSTGGPAQLEVHGVVGTELLAVLRSESTASLVAIDPVRGTVRTVVSANPASVAQLRVAGGR